MKILSIVSLLMLAACGSTTPSESSTQDSSTEAAADGMVEVNPDSTQPPTDGTFDAQDAQNIGNKSCTLGDGAVVAHGAIVITGTCPDGKTNLSCRCLDGLLGQCTGACPPPQDAGTDSPAPVSCGSKMCNSGEICLATRTIGGAPGGNEPDDAGNCPPGRHLEGNQCMPDWQLNCAPLQGTCSDSVTCSCAQKMCQASAICKNAPVTGAPIGCQTMAP